MSNPREASNAVAKSSTVGTGTLLSGVGRAHEEMTASFERFCLAAGLDVFGTMMEADAASLCGARHSRDAGHRGHRWGRTAGPIGFHGGKVSVERPRVREGSREVPLPSWQSAVREDWLGRWAINLMLIGEHQDLWSIQAAAA